MILKVLLSFDRIQVQVQNYI